MHKSAQIIQSVCHIQYMQQKIEEEESDYWFSLKGFSSVRASGA